MTHDAATLLSAQPNNATMDYELFCFALVMLSMSSDVLMQRVKAQHVIATFYSTQ